MSVTQEEGILPSASKLPLLPDTRSLVSRSSTAMSTKSVNITQQVALWASDVIARIDESIKNKKLVRDEDTRQLTIELVAVFITSLQQDSHPYWMYLYEVLNVVAPYVDHIQPNQQVTHYLERLYHHSQTHKEQLFDIPLLDRMMTIFPKEMTRIQKSGGNSRNYRTPLPPQLVVSSPRRSTQTQLRFSNGNNPFMLEHPDDVDKVRPKPLCFGDLAKSLPAVVAETAKREAVWSEGYGLIAQAMQTDLPEPPVAESTAAKQGETGEERQTWPVDPALFKDDLTVSEDAEEKHEQPPMTGKEVVELFGKGRHLGQVKFVYLNKAPSRHFRPYDLITVPKHKANPNEHWVMSCFGVLHVYKKKPAETMTLHEWHRECVLWSAITKLPFFKYFLVQKAFLRWKANMKFGDYCRIRNDLDNALIPNVPSFGAALLQISKLLQELGTIQFLPLELTQCYTLAQFEQNVLNKKKAAEALLEKFFNYCKLVVDMICEQTFDKLKFCENQARHQKAVQSKESLYVQRMKKEQREENLKLAKEEAGKLGNFVRLVDQMLLAHLVALARANISTFVGQTMQAGKEANRDGLYKTKLIFTAKSVLTLYPSKDKLLKAVSDILHSIPVVLCEMAQPMDVVTQAPSPTLKSESTNTRKRSSDKTLTPRGGSEMATTAGSQSVDTITHPTIASPVEATKSEDNIGVATPDLCVRPTTKMLIDGQGFMGQYSPLSKGNLADKLSNDEQVSEFLTLHKDIMISALADVDQFCKDHTWLADIHQFVRSWSLESCKVFKRAEAYTIETKLGEIRGWTEQVKNVDRFIVSENGLMYVDCGAIQEDIVPGLTGAFRDLLNYTANQAKGLSIAFSTEVKGVITGMKEKNTDIAAFAEYAKQYITYKNKTAALQAEVEYIKSLFEVIRLSYRALTSDEEKHEEKVWQSWEAFLLQLQDASDFVNTQTPIKSQELEETFQDLTDKAERICRSATTGPFLDPSQSPTQLLIYMKQLRDQFNNVQTKMNQYSQYRQAILGEPYDVSGLAGMVRKMSIRAELWKYVEVSTFAIQDWMNQLFRKFNVSKALDKITEWQQAAGQLKDHLPQGDAVLAHWYKLLNDFKQDLPLLQKLSSDSLKARHWKSLFVGLGQLYQPGFSYTVADLLSFNLSEHSLLINTVCSGALAEFALEQSLSKLKKMWEEKEFQLAKHIPIMTAAKKEPVSAKRRKKQRASIIERPHSSTLPDMYTLTRHDELKYLLQDNQVTIQSMIGSPHLAEMKSEAEVWAGILQQIEDMVDLWITCQSKWQYLSKVFSDPEMCRQMPEQAIKFEDVDLKFQEVMKSVVGDPRVLSILNKRKGQKGWREMQGDVLKKVYQTLIRKMEEILKSMDKNVDKIRNQFPRLFFLSNEEIVEMVSISRNMKGWLPYVRKCFQGIESLNYALPLTMDNNRMSTALDLALHDVSRPATSMDSRPHKADKLKVTSLEGELGETVALITPLEANSDVGQWLAALELNMKTTLGSMLRVCVETRLTDGLSLPEKILEELGELEQTEESSKEQEKLTAAVRHSYSHWLLRFPAQVVLITEALFWERDTYQALTDSNSKQQLQQLSEAYNRRLDQYLSVLHDNCNRFLTSHTRARLHVLLGTLINQGLHFRDIMQNLLLNDSPSVKCFEWLKILRYHLDIKTILCAQPMSVSQQQNYTDGEAVDGDQAETPTLGERMVTTVTTGYILGECQLQQLGSSFAYEYEYTGPTSRLVMTPLTDRCHLTLTLALQGYQCGTIQGPTGTGKSETIADLAKTMGRHCVRFNCTEGLHTGLISRLLSGVIQAGSWLIWENADRMPLAMMSLLGQQLEYLRHTFTILEGDSDNQYGTRGTTKHDTKSPRMKRRNSLTTLHSLPARPNIDREKTFPSIEKGPVTNYFEETFGEEEDSEVSPTRMRRHSIGKVGELDKSDYYTDVSPIPLFGEMHGPALYRARYKRLVKQTNGDADFTSLNQWTYSPSVLGNVLFDGNLMQANANGGCFMTLDSNNAVCQQIPNSLRVVMRPVAMVTPDRHQILEAMLCCKGFSEPKTLAAKLNMLYDILQKQLPDGSGVRFGPGLHSIKVSIQIATVKLFSRRQLHQLNSSRKSAVTTPSLSDIQEANVFDGTDLSEFDDESVRQEAALLFGIQKTLLPKLHGVEAVQIVKQAMRAVFPQSSRPGSAQEHDPVLVNAIQEQMVTDKLQANPQHVSKMLQLYESIQQKCGVVLIGASGSGKTTSYQTLARVLNTLHSNPPAKEDMTAYRTAPLRGPRIKALEGSEGRPCSSTASSVMDKVRHLSRIISAISLHWYDVVGQHTEDITYPRVDVSTVYPGVLNMHELYGTNSSTGMWKEGIVSKLIHDANAQTVAAQAMIEQQQEKSQAQVSAAPTPNIVKKWIVLDGDMTAKWVDHLTTLLDQQKKLCINNGEQLNIMDSTSMLFETCDMSTTSPALLSRCAVVYHGSQVVQWKMLFESWLQTAKARWELFNRSLDVLTSMMEDTFAATIKFLTTECCQSLTSDVFPASHSKVTMTTGIQEVSSFMSILSSLFDKHLLREDEEDLSRTPTPTPGEKLLRYPSSRPTTVGSLSRHGSSLEDAITPSHIGQIVGMFTFAYIWGFGGNLHQRCIGKFDRFVRHRLTRARHDVRLPGPGTVFDYTIDPSTGSLISWREYSQDGIKTLPSNFTIVPEMERYSHIIDLLLSCNYPVLLTGPPGVGKTSIMQNMVHSKHYFTRTVLSMGLDSTMLQQQIETRLEQVRQRAAAMAVSKGEKSVEAKHLFFLDDVNATPTDEQTGAQPCLELLRQMLNQGVVYDRQRLYLKPVDGAKFVAACVSPGVAGIGTGVAHQIIHPRLARLFTVLTVFPMSNEAVHQVYGKPLQSWLEEFPAYSIAHHYEMAHAILSATIELYSVVQKNLTPTPVNAHYVFSLHDVARCVSSMFLLSPRSNRTRPKPGRRRGGGGGGADGGTSRAGAETAGGSKTRGNTPSKPGGPTQQGQISDSSQGSKMKHSQSWNSLGSSSEGKAVATAMVTPPMMRVVIRLWCHEVTRTYYDRLLTDEDQGWFTRQLHDVVEKHFCTGRDGLGQEMETIQEIHEQTETESDIDRLRIPQKPGKGLTPPPPTPASSGTSSSQKTPTPQSTTRKSSTPTSKPQTAESHSSRGEQTKDAEPKDSDVKSPEEIDKPQTPKSDKTQDTSLTPRKDDGSVKDDEKQSKSVTQSSPESNETLRKISIPHTLGTTTETTTPYTERDSATESRVSTASVASSDYDAMTPYEQTPRSEANKTSTTERETATGTATGSRVGASAGILRQSTTPSTPGVLKSSTPREGDSRPTGAYRRGVTFKPGLIGDGYHGKYQGPLITMDQLCIPGENLSDIIFSQHLYSVGSRERGYNENSDSNLMDGVQRCLQMYNDKFTSKKLDTVLFKEALHHIAKLTRVLSMTGGNALLLGKTHCTGRATLTKLAAYAARCKLYEPKPSTKGDMQTNREKLRQYMKDASHVAGLQGKPVVLLVRDSMGDECMKDVSAFMMQGTLPNLYNEDETEEIATAMLPGSKGGGHRGQRLEMAVERYYRRVCNNMHIIVCIDFTDINYCKAITMLQKFPALLSRSCCIDVYFPWTHEALVSVATQWMRRETTDKQTGRLHYIPWRHDDPAAQISAICNAMAYIHQSSEHMVEGLYKSKIKFFTPTTYLEFVDLFKHIASKLAKRHKKTMIKYERALSRINVAYDTIANYSTQVDRLTPMLQDASQTVEHRQKEVEHSKGEYQKAKEECAQDEEMIAKMSAPMEKLKKQAQEEQNKIDPIYEAALHALNSLDQKDVQEIRTFHAPPEMVINVVNALCLLFKQPYNWESGKALLNRPNFFQDLEFFDKENIPDEIFYKLNVLFIQDPDFVPEKVQTASLPAGSLCRWVHAIYAYAEIHRNIGPKLEAIAAQEAMIDEALKKLGEKRVKLQQTKTQLEGRIQAQKEAQKSVRNMQKNMKGTQVQIAKASNLVENMTGQNASWKGYLSEAQSEFNTSPGDALLAAACVCYHGPMEQFAREVLLQDWIERCRTGKFTIPTLDSELVAAQSVTPALELVIQANKEDKPASRKASRDSRSAGSGKGKAAGMFDYLDDNSSSIGREGTPDTNIDSLPSSELQDAVIPAGVVHVREDFSLQVLLSSVEEQTDWHYRSIPHDTAAINNALIMRSCVCDGLYSWPLLIDPDRQAETWIKLLQDNMTTMTSQEDDTDDMNTIDNTTTDVADADEREGLDVSMVTGGGVIADDEWMSEGDEQQDIDRDTRLTLTSGIDTVTGIVDDFTPRTTSFGDALSGTGTMAKDHYTDSETATDIHGASELDQFEAWDIDIEPDFDQPADNLWIISADDVNFNSKIVHAVVFGVTLVITNIERLPPDYALYDLLHRNVTVDKEDTSKQHIKIGGNEFDYNPAFQLYMITSVPITIKGPGLLPLPMQHSAVIDLSISQQGVFDRILQITMKIERPEYENQHRSIESDLRHYKQQLQEVQDAILDKTLNLKNSVLEEDDMLPALISCQTQTFSLQTNIAETQLFAEQLDGKRKNYIPVAKHGSVLYSVIKHLPKLHPLYHFKLMAFISVCEEAIKSRSTGKAGAGGLSAKARASELTDVLTRSIHQWIATAVSNQHSQLFAFLVAMEKLRLTGGVTNHEWSVFVDGINLDMIDIKDIKDKPEWISEKAWLDFGVLEDLEDFEGLRDSILKYTKQWQEYFEGTPVLLSLVPDDNQAHLNIMQKAILWRIMQPHLLSQLCQDITVYQLGASIAKFESYNIEKVLMTADQHTPIVFILPASYSSSQDFNASKGHCLFDPVLEVMHYGKTHNMEGQIHTVPLGTIEQMNEAVAMIQYSMKAGDWVVLSNCHLATEWSKDLIYLLQDMIEMGSEHQDVVSKSSSRVSTASVQSKQSIHPGFRLMMVTQSDVDVRLPGLVVQHGYKVACETSSNFKTLLQQCYNDSIATSYANKHLTRVTESKPLCDLMFTVSLLHSLLNQRRTFQQYAFVHDCHWSHCDFFTAVKCMQTMVGISGIDSHEALQYIMGDIIYGGHTLDISDKTTIKAVANASLLPANHKQLQKENIMGVSALLKSLLPEDDLSREEDGSYHGYQEAFDQMREKVTAHQLGLAETAYVGIQTMHSGNLLNGLKKIAGISTMGPSLQMDILDNVSQSLEDITKYLQGLPALPQAPEESLSYVDNFLANEVFAYQKSLNTIHADVHLCVAVAKGETACTPAMQVMMDALKDNMVPSSWLPTNYPVQLSVDDFFDTLQRKLELLSTYCSKEKAAISYNLAVFNNPEAFSQCVLMEHARREYIECQQLTLQTHILSSKESITSPPDYGVYLTGLCLHNASWDNKDGSIHHDAYKPSLPLPSQLPVIWLKPSSVTDSNDTDGQQQDVFQCPVITAMNPLDRFTHNRVICHVDLPCKQHMELCTQRRLYAIVQLSD
ncbi:dynein heavy chain domain-containing protein 1-like [Glandiceps talaboti]